MLVLWCEPENSERGHDWTKFLVSVNLLREMMREGATFGDLLEIVEESI
jgi:hypothetical protein